MAMRWIKWGGIAAAILLVISCFSVWVVISSRNIVVTGIESAGTNFGKPGYLHFFFILFFVVFTLVPRIWAKRANLLVTSLNLAWAIRNYFIISACSAGECPEKRVALYLLVLASLLMLISALFPDMEVKQKDNQ